MVLQVNWETGGQGKAEQVWFITQQVFCVCGQVVDEQGVKVVEGNVPVGVQKPAVKEVKGGQDYDGAGVGRMVDGWQGLELFEDAFPKGVCEASMREGSISRVDAEV